MKQHWLVCHINDDSTDDFVTVYQLSSLGTSTRMTPTKGGSRRVVPCSGNTVPKLADHCLQDCACDTSYFSLTNWQHHLTYTCSIASLSQPRYTVDKETWVLHYTRIQWTSKMKERLSLWEMTRQGFWYYSSISELVY